MARGMGASSVLRAVVRLRAALGAPVWVFGGVAGVLFLIFGVFRVA
jgi:hypothetical protein